MLQLIGFNMSITVKYYQVTELSNSGDPVITKDVGWTITKQIDVFKKQKVDGEWQEVESNDLGEHSSTYLPKGQSIQEVTKETYDNIDTAGEALSTQKRRTKNERFITAYAARLNAD
jgi:hypothetical protein